MLNEPQVIKSIIASVIASILVIIFIQPILTSSGKFFIWLGEIFYSGLANMYYEDAALGLREKHSFITLNILFLLVIPFVFFETLKVLGPDLKIKMSLRKLQVLLIIATTGFLILSFAILTVTFASFQMNASFNQRMVVIKTLVDEKSYDLIKADWALMKSQEDYDNINKKMEKIAKYKGISLPKNLW